MRYDSVIIGSGVSGLTAALLLAQNGHKVAIIEKCAHLAPLLSRFKRGNVWCDPGLHYTGGLEESGTLSVIFRYLKMRDNIRSIDMKGDCFDKLFISDREIPLPCGFDGVERSLTDSYPKSARAVSGYISKIKTIRDSTPFVNFNLSFNDFKIGPDSEISLYDFLDSLGAEEELKSILSQYGEFLYGVSGKEIPFFVHALIMGFFYNSPQTVASGGDEVVNAFRKRLSDENVDIFLNSAAKKIEVDKDNKLRALTLSDGNTIETTDCIFTPHPHLLPDIAPSKGFKPAYLRRIKEMENTPGPFTVYLELDEIPEKISHTNLYKLSNEKIASNRDGAFAVMSCDPEIYDGKRKGLCIMQLNKNRLAETLSMDNNYRSSHYKEYKEIETSSIIDRLLAFLPEIDGKFKVVSSASPLTYESYTGTSSGAAYGLKQSVNQIKLEARTSIAGLYLAGQSILMPGLMGASISGVISAANILGMDELWGGLQKCR
ncbi:MAG: FAD-dependent oxidoreductase [bacterium]|nr:FAD-dependent oxidoreductase [bacterium]